MNRYHFGLGEMPPNSGGRRPQAIIIYTDWHEILRVPYDEAAKALLRAFAPDKLPAEDAKA